jgi:hypothetical protein
MALLLLSLGLSAYFIQVGFRHVWSASILRWSQQEWGEGKYLESARWRIVSYQDALRAGVRWTVVERFYLNRMTELRDRGKPEEALDACRRAISVLAGDDDEGVVSYECAELEREIANQK